MRKHAFTVVGDESPCTLSELLARRLSLAPAEAERWVREGRVYVDGRRVRRSTDPLRPGQKVVAHAPPPGPDQTREASQGRRRQAVEADEQAPRSLEVAYQDDRVAVVDKPPGMPSEPTRVGGAAAVSEAIQALFGAQARLLHRLDQEASGLLLVSLERRGRSALVAQVQGHELDRRYLAIAAGQLAAAELTFESRLSARRGRTRRSADPRARLALTHVRLLRQLPDRCLVQVRLTTGRLHQIRAHLAEAGHPLVGDDRYGGPEAERLALHAHCLGFHEPGGRRVAVHSPLPGVLRRWVEG